MLTTLGLICMIAFIIPFIASIEKNAFIVYIWVVLGLLIFVWGQDFYYQFTHPLNENFGRAIVMGMVFIISSATIFPILIVIFWKNLYISVLKGFIIPLIIIFISTYMVFQGYLLFSAYNAYDAAKQIQAKDIETKDMFDFYSPTIKHITIQAGNPTRYYRWSYRRSRYVFEVNQLGATNKHDAGNNISFWHMLQYSKDYHFSIPKIYIKKNSHFLLSDIIIPSASPLSHYFNFDKRKIEVHSSNNKNLGISVNKALKDQYGLKKGIDDGYYYNDNRDKYGYDYLTYYNDTVSIQCHYIENNNTSDICHMSMLSNGFEYKFDMYKKYIPQWQQIYTGLSSLIQSFIVDVKNYPKTLDPYFEEKE